jgi:hypothetical protein
MIDPVAARARHAAAPATPTTASAAGDPSTPRRRYVLCTTPAQGHTAPLVAVSGRLVAQGHDVVFFTTEHYR